MSNHNDRSAAIEHALTGKDFYDMSGPDLLAYCGADASKWAEAFCKIKEVQGWGTSDIDEGLMVGWFANAIEHSEQVRHTPDDAQSLAGDMTLADLITMIDMVQNHTDAIDLADRLWPLIHTTGVAQPAALRAAAEHVCWFDWSGNDMDAIAAIEELRKALASQPSPAATVETGKCTGLCNDGSGEGCNCSPAAHQRSSAGNVDARGLLALADRIEKRRRVGMNEIERSMIVGALRHVAVEPQPAPDIAAGMTKAMEIVGEMRMSEAGIFDEKHSGQRGEDRSNALYDAYVAIRSALSRPHGAGAV